MSIRSRLIEQSKLAEHLEEDFPDITAFLRSQLTGNSICPSEPPVSLPSQYQQDAASESLESELLLSMQDIIQCAEAAGTDPEEGLREVVSRAVLGGVLRGYQMSDQRDQEPQGESGSPKHSRTDDGATM